MGSDMGIKNWFKTSDQPKTGSGHNHPRLPARNVTVTHRTADGKKIPKATKKK